jgi:hypothetical protein
MIFKWKEFVSKDGDWFLDLVSISDGLSYLYVYEHNEVDGLYGFELDSAWFHDPGPFSHLNGLYFDEERHMSYVEFGIKDLPRSLKEIKHIVEYVVAECGHKVLDKSLEIYV